MYRKIWISLNVLLVALSVVYIWLFRPHDNIPVLVGQMLAQFGFLLFVVNVNMYFIFLVIRKTPQRNIKIILAKFSRKMMKGHIVIALTGTIAIFGHAFFMNQQFASVLGYSSMKFVSAYIAVFFLAATLISGYLRHLKASGWRRKLHLLSAMMFAASFLFHMFS